MKLKEYRKNANKTQNQIAKIIGIPQPTYGNYESGARQVPDDIKIELAKYYKISVDELMGYEKETRPNWDKFAGELQNEFNIEDMTDAELQSLVEITKSVIKNIKKDGH